MPDASINGLFYDRQILTADGLGAFGASSLSDGILTGLDGSMNSNVLTVGNGWVIICGRPVYIEGRTFTITPTAGTTMYYMLKIAADLNEAATESTFEQVSLSMVSGSSLSSLLTSNVASGSYISNGSRVYTNDLNNSGMTASNWLILLKSTSGAAPTIEAYNRAVAKSMVQLWENTSIDYLTEDTSSSSFAGIAFGSIPSGQNTGSVTITLPELYGYNAVLIQYRGSLERYSSSMQENSYNLSSMVCPYEPGVNKTYYYNLTDCFLTHSFYDYTYQRIVKINGASATIEFLCGRYGGNKNGWSPYVCIPGKIFGMRIGY